MAEYDIKIKYIQKVADEQIEHKKTLLAQLKKEEIIAQSEIENNIELKKHELDELPFQEKNIKAKIEKYQQELSEIESRLKLLKDSKDISQSREYLLNKLSVENDYHNTYQRYFELNENAKYSLLEQQKKMSKVSNEIKDLEKTKNNIKADPYLQPDLYKIQKEIINVTKELKKLEKGKNNIQEDSTYGKKISDIQKNITEISKEIEKLEKEKMNIQNIQIIQPPVTTELPKTNKIKRNVTLSSLLGLFFMLFSSFFLEYLYNYKKRGSDR